MARAATGSNQDIARKFAHLHGLVRIKTRQLSRTLIEEWLENNIPLVESLNLRDRALDTFLVPDDIAAVRGHRTRNDADPVFYIVVEASYTGEQEDIEKATDHAKIVHAVTGAIAYPVVAAVQVDDEMDEETRNRLYEDVNEFIAADGSRCGALVQARFGGLEAT